VRIKKPDLKNALSILQAAQRDMKFTLTLPKTEQSSTTIVRNIYESFRMLGDALLVNKGILSKDHIAPINELLKTKTKTKRPLNLIDNLRRLRHNINYYGYTPSAAELENAISLSKDLFKPLVIEIKKQIK